MADLPDSLIVKGYEVGYALFRVAGTLPERTYKTHLEDKALDIILAALEGKVTKEKKNIYIAEYLVRFLSDVGAIHLETANLLLKELAEFNSAIAGIRDAEVQPLKESELFPDRKDQGIKRANAEEKNIKEKMERHPNSLIKKAEGFPLDGYKIRQEKILEKIRQFGKMPGGEDGCRLRDIQTVLPDFSERTLRYDLQRMVQEGSIERIGNGGPATFYRPRTGSEAILLP